MPLMSLTNYLVPASGNCNGFMVDSPADGYIFDPSQISSETGQLFIPSGFYADGIDAGAAGMITMLPLGIKIPLYAGQTNSAPFPSVEGARFSFESCEHYRIIFVDYPVIPFVQ